MCHKCQKKQTKSYPKDSKKQKHESCSCKCACKCGCACLPKQKPKCECEQWIYIPQAYTPGCCDGVGRFTGSMGNVERGCNCIYPY